MIKGRQLNLNNPNTCEVLPNYMAVDYLEKENYLSEFSTEEDRSQARENLGITQKFIGEAIPDYSITNKKLSNYAVSFDKLQSWAVTESKIADDAVSFKKLTHYVQDRLLPANIISDDGGTLYISKNGNFLPLSHPDLSTQPSRLPQRFGTYKIYEVLLPYLEKGFDYSQLPSTSVILECFVFSDTFCEAGNCAKINGKWKITNIISDFTPLYALVKYINESFAQLGEYNMYDVIGQSGNISSSSSSSSSSQSYVQIIPAGTDLGSLAYAYSNYPIHRIEFHLDTPISSGTGDYKLLGKVVGIDSSGNTIIKVENLNSSNLEIFQGYGIKKIFVQDSNTYIQV